MGRPDLALDDHHQHHFGADRGSRREPGSDGSCVKLSNWVGPLGVSFHPSPISTNFPFFVSLETAHVALQQGKTACPRHIKLAPKDASCISVSWHLPILQIPDCSKVYSSPSSKCLLFSQGLASFSKRWVFGEVVLACSVKRLDSNFDPSINQGTDSHCCGPVRLWLHGAVLAKRRTRGSWRCFSK